VDSSSAIRGTLAGVLLAAIALCPFNEQATSLVDAAAVTKTKAPAHVTIATVAGTGLAGQSGQATAARHVPIRIRPKKSRPTLVDQIDAPAATITSLSVDAASAADVASAPAAEKAVSFAMKQLGLPYEWGGAGPDAYDCSGLTMRAYQAAGYQLPRTAAEQARVGQPVDLQHLLPGDLLFYATDPADLETVHHVVMYIGDGMVVHAPHTGDVVRVGPMWTGSE
jgi:cell wall-associated NlpC family hydrolase